MGVRESIGEVLVDDMVVESMISSYLEALWKEDVIRAQSLHETIYNDKKFHQKAKIAVMDAIVYSTMAFVTNEDGFQEALENVERVDDEDLHRMRLDFFDVGIEMVLSNVKSQKDKEMLSRRTQAFHKVCEELF